MVPRAVLMNSGLVSFNTTRQVNVAHIKTTVNAARPMSYFSKKAHSTIKRPDICLIERIKKTKRSKNDQKPTRNERDKNKSEETAKDQSRISPTQQERQSKVKIMKPRAENDKSSKFKGHLEF
ncbi:hypothetical protein Tco_0063567 [Tanacetum coccineum]